MQIFELHFNPKNKEGKLIDTFSYQPEDVYEKRLGALTIGGELTNGSSNKTLLNNLANKIKGTYHSLPTRSQEEALREGLKEGNNFLKKQKWDGDLNVAVLSIKNNELQFSKVGNLKILLSRNKEITDIGKNADEEKESFGSIVTGKIKKTDKIIVLTKEIYNEFVDQDLLIDLAENKPISDQKLEKISKIQKEKFPKVAGICLLIDFTIKTSKQEKIINKDQFSFKKTFLKAAESAKRLSILLFDNLKKFLLRLFKAVRENGKPLLRKGVSLSAALIKDLKKATVSFFSFLKSKAVQFKNRFKQKVEERKERKEELKKIENKNSQIEESKDESGDKNRDKSGNKSKEIFNLVKEKKGLFLDLCSNIKSFVTKESKKTYEGFKSTIKKLKKENYLPEIPKFKIPTSRIKKRNLYLISLLVLIIITGSLVAHSERRTQLEHQEALLSEISERIEDIDVEDSDAYENLIYHYENLKDLTDQRIAYQAKAERLKSQTSQKLLEMNNTRIVEDPQLIFEANEIIPSKIELVGDEIYSYNPFLSSAEKYNLATDEQLITPIRFNDGGIFSISSTDNDLFFFSRPNEIISHNDTNTSRQLASPYESYSYQQLESFQNYLYFLERRNNQIIRYSYPDLDNPEIWIEERVPGNIVSFAIDGNIWMLKDNNEIWEYGSNRPIAQSKIKHEQLFPKAERFSSIKTNSTSPIHVLESRNKRVIIFSKEGELLKQIIFPNSQNIKDLAIDNNKIYLLDGQEVYMVEVNL